VTDNGDVPDLGAIRRARQDAGLSADPPMQPLSALMGAAFNPAPFTYRVVKGATAVSPCVYLIVETAVGRFAVAMDRDEAVKMGGLLIEEASGLVVQP
jgi:hypothetical protein